MIEKKTTDTGLIYSYCEYNLVNKTGQKDPDGEYIFIDDLWVHPNFRNNGTIKYYIQTITDKFPKAKWGYFVRGWKYPDRKARIYSREKWLKRGSYETVKMA